MRKINRFMFVVPNGRWFGKRCWMWFAPAVPLLVPILKQCSLEVEVVEANIDNLTRDQVKQRIADFQPDVIGITNMSLEYWRQAHLAAKLAKEAAADAIIVMGGVHATCLPEKVMEDPNIDYVILREGEERLPRFLDVLQSTQADFSTMEGIAYRKNGQVVINPPLGFVKDLDALPLPDYTLFDWEKVMNFQQKGAAGGIGSVRAPVGVMLTSRGCPFRCCFCAGGLTMGRKTRLRSVEMVLREIDMLVQDFGIQELMFQDDEMYADRSRAVKIIEGIRDRHYDLIWKNTNVGSWRMDNDLLKLMKESGCYQMTISPESGSERVLKEIIHKPGRKDDARNVARWCKELGLDLEADFVIGFPGETWDEIRETTNFAEELDADVVKFAVATPFPGTELFRVAVEKGYLPADFNFYRDDALGFANPVIETEEFTIKELKMLRCLEWDRINFKTREKSDRYRRINVMTNEELQEFRRATRRSLGVYYVDQVTDEREPEDEGYAGSMKLSQAKRLRA